VTTPRGLTGIGEEDPIHDAQFRLVAYHDGLVDIELATRDAWSLDPGVSAGRSGGANSFRPTSGS
jgi:hypothetical protein